MKRLASDFQITCHLFQPGLIQDVLIREDSECLNDILNKQNHWDGNTGMVEDGIAANLMKLVKKKHNQTPELTMWQKYQHQE